MAPVTRSIGSPSTPSKISLPGVLDLPFGGCDYRFRLRDEIGEDGRPRSNPDLLDQLMQPLDLLEDLLVGRRRSQK